ncbi:hypothetical protein EDB87DRAFT_1640322, partial [Lactarius vividus]
MGRCSLEDQVGDGYCQPSCRSLHPIAKMAYSLLSAIPKSLLEQFQRDDNVQTLLVAVHDAFDFAN